jgi:hypothetical protein
MKTTDPWLREPNDEVKYEMRFSIIDYFLIFAVIILSAKWVAYAMFY